MTRLIDKKVVLEAVKALPAELDAETVQRCIEVLSNQPTVDAVPVRHGKWIRTGRTNIYGGYELECPLCGDKVMVQNIERELYCRNCGADMRG